MCFPIFPLLPQGKHIYISKKIKKLCETFNIYFIFLASREGKKWWEKWEKWETISESLDLSGFQEIIAVEKSGKLVGKSQKKWEKHPKSRKGETKC